MCYCKSEKIHGTGIEQIVALSVPYLIFAIFVHVLPRISTSVRKKSVFSHLKPEEETLN